MSNPFADRACERSSLCEVIHFGGLLLTIVVVGMLILMAGCATVREPETVSWEVIYES